MPDRFETAPCYRMLSDIATKFPPDTYLEIGCREGDSLKVVLEFCRPRKVIIADNWGTESGGSGRGNHDHLLPLVAGIPEVQWLDGNSRLTIPFLPDASIDLAFVDGDHSALGGLTDLVNVWLKLRPGGFLVFDDIIHPQHEYLKLVAQLFASQVGAEVVDMDDVHGYGAICFRKKP